MHYPLTVIAVVMGAVCWMAAMVFEMLTLRMARRRGRPVAMVCRRRVIHHGRRRGRAVIARRRRWHGIDRHTRHMNAHRYANVTRMRDA